jgi:catechol 2,3-dioxygenase-like lactoylglutathione lyase family enzyme
VTKKRTSEPWIPAADYGRLLPPFSINLLVRDIETSLRFYREVLGASVHYADVDFGALKVGGSEVQLHADHTYDGHPWYGRLSSGERRGLGAELRLLGLDPESIEDRAQRSGAKVVKPVTERGHGWREVMVEDPDGYVWAVGVLTEEEAPS